MRRTSEWLEALEDGIAAAAATQVIASMLDVEKQWPAFAQLLLFLDEYLEPLRESANDAYGRLSLTTFEKHRPRLHKCLQHRQTHIWRMRRLALHKNRGSPMLMHRVLHN